MATEQTLKEKNTLSLALVIFINLILYYLLSTSGLIDAKKIIDNLNEWQKLVPSTALIVFSLIINGIIGATNKSRLVFLKWNNTLPGCEAFSKHAMEDERIDTENLKKLIVKIPQTAREENACWYKIYRSLKNEIEINKAHQYYLFARDYTAISFLFIIFLGTTSFYLFLSPKVALYYIAILIIQFVLARNAAKNYGIRLVTTTLSIYALKNQKLTSGEEDGS
ncbi:MAG: hypothetical protein ACOY4F_11100 [Thermodesulfobacteriota bacterium]